MYCIQAVKEQCEKLRRNQLILGKLKTENFEWRIIYAHYLNDRAEKKNKCFLTCTSSRVFK